MRGLISSGDLPSEPPRGRTDNGAGLPSEASISTASVGGALCLICAQAGPETTYAYPDGRRIHVHRVPCEAAWRDEAVKTRRSDPTPQEIALPKDPFVQWLDGRLEQDADFETRMEAALRELRIERIAAAIHLARARAKRGEHGASHSSIT